MYIYGSCLGLGIGIKISDVSVGPSVIDPNEGCTPLQGVHFC